MSQYITSIISLENVHGLNPSCALTTVIRVLLRAIVGVPARGVVVALVVDLVVASVDGGRGGGTASIFDGNVVSVAIYLGKPNRNILPCFLV